MQKATIRDRPEYTLDTDGMISDFIVPVPESRQNQGAHIYDRALYRNLLSEYRYQCIQRNPDFTSISKHVRYILSAQLRPYRPGRGHGTLYDGKGTIYQLEGKRNRFIKSAQEYDLTHPLDVWCTLVQQIEQPHVVVKFYNTLEELLVEHLHGKFNIEIFTNGSVRIIKADMVVSIFHLSPAGVAEYRKLMFKPIASTDSKQNLYTFIYLSINKGYMYTPGPKFLSSKYKDWCEGEGSGRNVGYHRDHDKYNGCKKDIQRDNKA